MPNCAVIAASPLDGTNEEMPGNPRASILPVTPDNVQRAQEFPHCGMGTDRGSLRSSAQPNTVPAADLSLPLSASMLTFYINRFGKNLPKMQRERLQRAKSELKREFGKL
jgi:Protein of unknown function (DUF3175)